MKRGESPRASFLKRAAIALVCVAALPLSGLSQTRTIQPLPGERWWGGATIFGREQPYANFVRCDQNRDNYCNQISPFFVSSAGRYVWSAKPVAWSVTNGVLTVESAADVELVTAGKTLREAFVAAAKRHFPSDGRIPPEIFFSRPQYNHAIESHVSGRNQVSVERYARISVTTPSPRRPAAGSAVLTTRRRPSCTSPLRRRSSRWRANHRRRANRSCG